MIGHPAGHVAGILRDEREPFGVEIDPVDVEDLRVALVHRDQHFVVIVITIVDDRGLHLLERREVDEVFPVGIDRHHVEIFVALEILQVDDTVRSLPEISRNVALGLAGDAHGLAAGARPHEHVHAVLIRLHERNAVAVRRDLEAGPLRVPEEVAQWNEFAAAGRARGRGHGENVRVK